MSVNSRKKDAIGYSVESDENVERNELNRVERNSFSIENDYENDVIDEVHNNEIIERMDEHYEVHDGRLMAIVRDHDDDYDDDDDDDSENDSIDDDDLYDYYSMEDYDRLIHAINLHRSENKILALIESTTVAVIQERDDDAEYILHLACRHCSDYDTVIIKLLEIFPMATQHQNNEWLLPLHTACYSSDTSENILMKLIESFPEAAFIKCNERWGGYALHLACQYVWSERVIRKLIEINPMSVQEIDDEDGNYPIHCAYRTFNGTDFEQENAIFQMLLDADPLVIQRQNNAGNSPLHLACWYERSPIVILEYIVQHSTGSQINIRNNREETPLHLACLNKYDNCVEALLKHPNINPNATEKT